MRFSFYFTLSTLVFFAASSARAADAVSYTKDVKPFLDKYCNSCHMAAKPKGGVSTDTYQGLLKKSAVVPGKPASSTLLLTMEGTGKKKMPPRKEKTQPTATEIAKVKTWIAGGAKDDTKTSALPLTREDTLFALLLNSSEAVVSRRELLCQR